MGRLRDSIIVDPQKDKREASFFAFDIFITPFLVQISFVLGSIYHICSSVWYLWYIWNRDKPDAMDMEVQMILQFLGQWSYFLWAIWFCWGLILLRVVCEFIIVIFKIYQELRSR